MQSIHLEEIYHMLPTSRKAFYNADISFHPSNYCNIIIAGLNCIHYYNNSEFNKLNKIIKTGLNKRKEKIYII